MNEAEKKNLIISVSRALPHTDRQKTFPTETQIYGPIETIVLSSVLCHKHTHGAIAKAAIFILLIFVIGMYRKLISLRLFAASRSVYLISQNDARLLAMIDIVAVPVQSGHHVHSVWCLRAFWIIKFLSRQSYKSLPLLPSTTINSIHRTNFSPVEICISLNFTQNTVQEPFVSVSPILFFLYIAFSNSFYSFFARVVNFDGFFHGKENLRRFGMGTTFSFAFMAMNKKKAAELQTNSKIPANWWTFQSTTTINSE